MCIHKTPKMKIISFDVGIKNLAYCLFETHTEGRPPTIIDWKVLSLMDEPATIPLCIETSPTSSKAKKTKNSPKPCNHKSKFATPLVEAPSAQAQAPPQIFLCDKHAKALADRGEWLLPDPKFKNVKKMKLEELMGLAISLGFSLPTAKKPEVLAWVDDYLAKKRLVGVGGKKSATAGEADLISLGRAMKKIFQDLLPEDISVVLIENQISPLASRMKTVQGMLAQYFIMRYEGVRVEFISSANKLKMFSKEDVKKKEMNEVGGGVEQTQAQKYKSHKKDGVFYCQQVLDKKVFDGGEQWVTCERKKKDDLADCFLQGVWWLKREGGMNIE